MVLRTQYSSSVTNAWQGLSTWPMTGCRTCQTAATGTAPGTARDPLAPPATPDTPPATVTTWRTSATGLVMVSLLKLMITHGNCEGPCATTTRRKPRRYCMTSRLCVDMDQVRVSGAWQFDYVTVWDERIIRIRKSFSRISNIWIRIQQFLSQNIIRIFESFSSNL